MEASEVISMASAGKPLSIRVASIAAGVALGLSGGSAIGSHTSCCTSGDDNWEGHSSNETKHMLGGSDVGRGRGGADNLYGGNGQDQLVGNSGFDFIDGDDGHDVKNAVGLRGRDGNDTLKGNLGGDLVTDGDDQGDKDEVRGGAGGDILSTKDQDGNDDIYCGDGADILDRDSGDTKHDCAGDDDLSQ